LISCQVQPFVVVWFYRRKCPAKPPPENSLGVLHDEMVFALLEMGLSIGICRLVFQPKIFLRL
jgi:hypothetical protein